ncbi:hypothetical protein JTB14_017922 [Gonioctena quinquepunctata]|nr:hypothetical protein JTB14_017922 [Gonioctena quinquepunctata]
MKERLEQQQKQVRTDTENLTEITLNKMIAFNPGVEEINKDILKDLCREDVYNKCKEKCSKTKEQEINRLTSMLENVLKYLVKRFITPHKIAKAPTLPKSIDLETSNRFQNLPEKDNEEMDTGVSEEHSKEIIESAARASSTKVQQQPTEKARDRKVPPIIVAGRMAISQITMRKLLENTREKFILEHKPNSTIVLTQTIEDHADM